MKFEINVLRNSTVWQLYRMRDHILLDPPYQRLGDIWTLDKRELLIDTILNNFDVPKLYLHKFSNPQKKAGKEYLYAIIDGKQRLETIWKFIDGAFALSDEFQYYDDSTVKAEGMKYEDLGPRYPDLKGQFDGFPLSVVWIETDDIDMIEEMFSRLNEAATLNAPEKRNAMGGPVPTAIKALAREPFFLKRLPFANARYRHFDLAVKFLLIEREGKIIDTKKVYLDEFVREYKSKSRSARLPFVADSERVLGRMNKVFHDSDPLLRNIGMATLYYYLFHLADRDGWATKVTRQKLSKFEVTRRKNRELAESNLKKADYDLIEFDQFNQSPNDSYATRIRLEIILERLFNRRVPKDFLGGVEA